MKRKKKHNNVIAKLGSAWCAEIFLMRSVYVVRYGLYFVLFRINQSNYFLSQEIC
jgi:isoprenylcysteine carboxyl methyltransferase (ICMT) family protein YpbQ